MTTQEDVHIPKFGDWDSEEDIPYTHFFNTAHINKSGGKLFNPNDPIENPEAFPGHSSPINVQLVGSKADIEARKPEQPKKLKEFPLHYENSDVLKQQEFTSRILAHKDGQDSKSADVSSHSRDNSPIRSRIQEEFGSKRGSSSPNKNAFSPSKPPKKNPRQTSGSHSNHGSSVSKFSDWDESVSSSDDGYTHIFNKVREECNTPANVHATPPSVPHTTGYRPVEKDTRPKFFLCFCCIKPAKVKRRPS